jgi:ketosteroid isomerase-like protein
MTRTAAIYLLAAAVTLAHGQEPGKGARKDTKTVEAIKMMEQEWMKAYVKGDAAFLERHLSDDYTGTYPDGTALDKAGEIQAVKSGDVAITEMKAKEMKVRTYGDTAVITGRSAIRAKVKGQEVSGEFRFTDVWVKQGDQWKAVASQVTRIEKP